MWSSDEYSFYSIGTIDSTPVIAVATLTNTGYRVRSTMRDRLNHDYVSHELQSELLEWFRCDMDKTPLTTLDRQEVLEDLASGRVPTFLNLEIGRSEAEVAERVLRHLEHGW